MDGGRRVIRRTVGDWIGLNLKQGPGGRHCHHQSSSIIITTFITIIIISSKFVCPNLFCPYCKCERCPGGRWEEYWKTSEI